MGCFRTGFYLCPLYQPKPLRAQMREDACSVALPTHRYFYHLSSIHVHSLYQWFPLCDCSLRSLSPIHPPPRLF